MAGVKIRVAWLVLWAGLLACTNHREHQTMSSGTIDPPWSVTYHDGSNNGWRFWRESPQADAQFEYLPVRPEQSSSGTYSGGEPARGVLAPNQVDQLWQSVARLEADRSIHAASRKMGTGAFALEDARGKRSFVVEAGEPLREFERLVTLFR